MNTILKLSMIAALPVFLSALLYFLEQKQCFRKMGYYQKQIIFGVLFGALAIFGTEFGVNVGGATMNVRDAAPICAGLIFGAPAGIISGIIGGVERWFAVLWGAGEYTQFACTVATIVAGFTAAGIRKFMFDDKKPKWYYGLTVGAVIEILHMLLVFLTNMSDVHTAFTFVKMCSAPMIVLNSLSVMFSILVVSGSGKKSLKKQRGPKQISQTFQRWLLVCVVVAFLVTTVFSWALQTQLSESNAEELLKLNISDVEQDITDASDNNLLSITRTVADELNAMQGFSSDTLYALGEKHDIAEINVIDENGFITASTYPDFIGYDMRAGKQSSEFMVLLDGKATSFVQSYQATSSNSALYRKYAGAVLASGGFVQVAYDAERFQRDIDSHVIGATKNRHIGENGCLIITNENGKIVSDRHGNQGRSLLVSGATLDGIPEKTVFLANIYGESCYCMYVNSEGYSILGVMTQDEALFSRNVSLYVTVFIEALIFAVLFLLIYILIKKLIVDNIRKVNQSLSEITGGNLDVLVDVRSNEEFASLSDDINSTVTTLKKYIDEAAARIDKELEFARAIQHSSLPSVFPPFPERRDFDIFAQMDTAKEVGGDFYDFYFVGNNRLAFIIADVSGKGIPAAMFMMTAKTLIKGYAEAAVSVEETFALANEKLCRGNDANMFVTAWMGVIDLSTGYVEFANAGHNPPLVRHSDGSFEYLKSKPCFVLAGMEGIKYKKNVLKLLPGDKLFLYTDGVTEATDMDNHLYGDDRLKEILKSAKSLPVEDICKAVKRDVDTFVGEAAQFDDITMLCFEYKGRMQE